MGPSLLTFFIKAKYFGAGGCSDRMYFTNSFFVRVLQSRVKQLLVADRGRRNRAKPFAARAASTVSKARLAGSQEAA